MANNNAHNESDAQELKKSMQFWGNFNKVTKWTIIAVCAILVLMAITLV